MVSLQGIFLRKNVISESKSADIYERRKAQLDMKMHAVRREQRLHKSSVFRFLPPFVALFCCTFSDLPYKVSAKINSRIWGGRSQA